MNYRHAVAQKGSKNFAIIFTAENCLPTNIARDLSNVVKLVVIDADYQVVTLKDTLSVKLDMNTSSQYLGVDAALMSVEYKYLVERDASNAIHLNLACDDLELDDAEFTYYSDI